MGENIYTSKVEQAKTEKEQKTEMVKRVESQECKC